ncbi:MAG TPA: PDZ domain-containing protein [Rhizomicrobium sp.]|nr:PDZ domain-containing protein [Rhizomicrobium sp.]
MPPEIPAPRDIAYPGTIRLSVDATDVTRGVFRVHEIIPVHAGALTLLYPKWLPGNHAPNGTLDKFAGLVIRAGGKTIPWTRDVVDVFAFHVDVPEGVTALDLDFQFLSAVDSKEGRIVMTQEMQSLEWNSVALYPAGYFARDILFEPSVKFPAGWKFATALDPQTGGDTATFKPVPFNTLVDSPMIAGKYFARADLDPSGKTNVHLDVIGDRPEQIAFSPDQIALHRNLVEQAYRLFGSHHYDHYDFLLSLSDRMGGAGLEHHQSSEDGTNPKYFTHWDQALASRDLLSHEFTHSWNGKFRRPADLWTPNFNVPMRDSLLWVYEGQTQFWGVVLATRSGLFTKQDGLDEIAGIAAVYDNQAGRSWRPLQDTTNDPVIAQRRPMPWRSWQRSEDYYNEGLLIWLDADTLIRQKSGGQKSLDDFARGFFGINDGSFVTVTYSFDDVVKSLNDVMPYDWAGFLKARLMVPAPAPLDGLARGGYQLVYTDKPTAFARSVDTLRKQDDFSYSIGLTVDRKGMITNVAWDSPAAKAGVTVGSEIVALNGVAFDGEDLRDAITDARSGGPLQLILRRDKVYKTISIDYKGGLRYPHLERIANTPALLDDLLEPRR